jgi:hypothetical protein
MANRAYLLNTSTLTSDPFALSANVEKPGNDILEAAEAAYRVPIPWLLCFRAEDMQSVNVPMENDPELGEPAGPDVAVISLPCTTVVKAIENLKSTRPLFWDLAGDKQMGEAFYQVAIRRIEALPMPYLTINPIEVTFMMDHKESTRQMMTALSRNASSLAALKKLACFEDGAKPYPIDVLYSIPGPHHDEQRIANTIALNMDYSNFWHRSDSSAENPFPDYDMEFGRDFPLRKISDHTEGLARKYVQSASASYAFVPSESDPVAKLKMLLMTETRAECDALLRNREFRAELDGRIHQTLVTVCGQYGFRWIGCVFDSSESAKDDDSFYTDWMNRPVAPNFRADEAKPEKSFTGWLGKLTGKRTD